MEGPAKIAINVGGMGDLQHFLDQAARRLFDLRVRLGFTAGFSGTACLARTRGLSCAAGWSGRAGLSCATLAGAKAPANAIKNAGSNDPKRLSPSTKFASVTVIPDPVHGMK